MRQKQASMTDFSKFNSLISLVRHFNSEDKCRKTIRQQRWSNGIVCPYCGSVHCYERSDGRFICKDCESSFSELVGTIFENTKLPLVKWFMAMYLISSHKKGISSLQLAQDIHVTQKTAWFMLHKIRTLYVQDKSMLHGDVECDETYIGGKETNKHESKKTSGNQGRSTKTKSGVFGMVERNSGNIAAMRIPDSRANTLTGIINLYVKAGSRIFTDEYIGYHSLKDSERYEHLTVHHKDKEFVRDDSHTNTIEGFWGQLKRMIMGVYHFVSAKYLQRYIDEAVFRYNTCRNEEGDRFKRMFDRSIDVVSYKSVRMVA